MVFIYYFYFLFLIFSISCNSISLLFQLAQPGKPIFSNNSIAKRLLDHYFQESARYYLSLVLEETVHQISSEPTPLEVFFFFFFFFFFF